VAHRAQDRRGPGIGGERLLAGERAGDQRVDQEVEQPEPGDGDADGDEAGRDRE